MPYLYASLAEPTVVSHCITASFTDPDAHNLIVVRSCVLEVYTIEVRRIARRGRLRAAAGRARANAGPAPSPGAARPGGVGARGEWGGKRAQRLTVRRARAM